ncbi:hypothetical protein NST28_08295 [Paenibacillus sp. FSL R10-2791]|uniref:hypothetical protein n=1 Tax=unclassified Paenibacillus TaxID=185978 RepID=UPI0030CFBD22
MKNIYTRKVLTLMLILSMFSFMGCGSREEKSEKKILSSLQEKYGEEFILDGIGGGWGTMNNNTLKATVHPKKDDTINVRVEITKDLEKVYDNYLNQVVAKKDEPMIQAIAASIWPDSKIIVANETGLVYPKHNDTKISYEQFLKLYPTNTLVISVYLNSDNYVDGNGDMDQEAEMRKYMDFAKILAENKYVSSLIGIGYLTPEAYGRLEEVKKAEESVDIYFSDETKKTGIINIVTMAGFKLGVDGKIVESQDKIREFFDIWKEDRIKRMEQRGGL